MKNILITGCAGFIGFHLSNKLKNDFSVYGIDNLSDYYDRNLKLKRLKKIENNINFQILDISDSKKLKVFFNSQNFDYIIHLAAQAGVRYSFENPDSYIKTNVLGTYNILENIKNIPIKHFIFSSTSSVYGMPIKHSEFFEKSDSSFPISLYASTKKSCETLIHNYSHNFGLPATVLRFFTVYGPWGRPDMALFKFVKSILKDVPIDVYNHGNMWRDFTYVDDLVESIYRLVEIIPNKESMVSNDTLSETAPFRIVNIGNQNSINLNDFIKCLEKTMNKKAIKNYMEIQPGDVPYTLSNSNLLEKLTDFKPSTPIEEGIEKFYSWYKHYYNI